MIKHETVEINGRNLVKSYSDSGFKIQQNETGIVYNSAIDVENAAFTYTETNTPTGENDIPNEEAYNIIMGVRE